MNRNSASGEEVARPDGPAMRRSVSTPGRGDKSGSVRQPRVRKWKRRGKAALAEAQQLIV